jgi:hypothetical protein
MKVLIRLVLLLLVVASSLLFVRAGSPQQSSGEVYVIVQDDATGRYVRDAKIEWTAKRDSEPRRNGNPVSLPYGQHELTVFEPGFVTDRRTVEVNAIYQVVRVGLTLGAPDGAPAYFDVTGRLVPAPPSGSDIWVKLIPVMKAELGVDAALDGAGRFRFPDVFHGVYVLLVIDSTPRAAGGPSVRVLAHEVIEVPQLDSLRLKISYDTEERDIQTIGPRF